MSFMDASSATSFMANDCAAFSYCAAPAALPARVAWSAISNA